jgi:diacylglycerol kinase family enzyme
VAWIGSAAQWVHLAPGVTLRVRSVRITKRRGRLRASHADGDPVGVTPASFDVVPGALRVIVGPPDETGIRASEVVGPVGG